MTDPQPSEPCHRLPRTLGEYPISASSRRIALVIVAASVGMFLALVPFAARPVAPRGWFIPLVQPVLVVNDLITATLLFGYLRLSRKPAILVLACGYLFSAVMASVHLLTFPGVFAPGGLLGAGPQSTGYLHVFWHAGFPLAVIAYAASKHRRGTLTHLVRATWLAVMVTCAVTLALATLAIQGHDLLPQMLQGHRYSSTFNVGRYGQWLSAGVALVVLLRSRLKSALDLWLAVVLAAWVFEIGLVSIFNAGRWDVGFYAGRFYALLASCAVLAMLLGEHVTMYRDLAHAHESARGASELREGREMLRLALLSGRAGVFSRDMKAHRVWWSPELEHLVGLPPGAGERDAGSLSHYVFPEDREQLWRGIGASVQDRKEFAVEFRLRTAQGEPRWASARGEATYDEEGRPETLFGVVADITDRKRNEEAAAAVEAHFRTLANEIPQLAWMSHADGSVYWLNRRWYEYTGLTPERSEGWAWQEAYEPAVLHKALPAWRHSIATGEPYEMIASLRGADGSLRPFLTRVVPFKDAHGRVIAWFGTHTDIAAQQEVHRELRNADKRKDEFLAILAHELRNPLAPIRNAIELLALTTLPPAADRARVVIDRQSRHLARLVDDLLEVSRITQGKVQLHKEHVSVVDCLSDALHAVEAPLESAGHALNVDMPEDPLYANADPTRLVQCFVNLLNNAIKFTPRGGRIDVAARRAGGLARVTVSDSGVGIAKSDLGKIFGLFAQVGAPGERTQGGLGIGLSLVQGFVELHGGSVRVDSAGPGQGSRFTVDLPLLESKAVATGRERRVPAARVHPRKVLVVDDNVDAAASMSALLQSAGHEVREAHDGPAGLRLAAEFRPDVILLDIGMPGMSGLEVARELRTRMRGAPAPRIIAVTGWGQERDRQLTREAGFDDHLTKPVSQDQLDVLLSLG